MLKYRKDKNDLQKYMLEHKAYFSNLDSESYYAVSAFLRSDRLLKKAEQDIASGKEERLDMCEALEELYEDGIERGMEKGIEQEKKRTALSLKKMGMSEEQIAQAVDRDISIVKGWLNSI